MAHEWFWKHHEAPSLLQPFIQQESRVLKLCPDARPALRMLAVPCSWGDPTQGLTPVLCFLIYRMRMITVPVTEDWYED